MMIFGHDFQRHPAQAIRLFIILYDGERQNNENQARLFIT